MFLGQKSIDATEESCLSLLGGPRKCKRYEEIEVEYLDINWKNSDRSTADGRLR